MLQADKVKILKKTVLCFIRYIAKETILLIASRFWSYHNEIIIMNISGTLHPKFSKVGDL